MRTYTVHTRPGRPFVVLREGFSLWAAVFGPFWLLAQRAWLPGLAVLGVNVLLLLTPEAVRPFLGMALAILTGLLGRDMVRWSLGRRGYALQHVVAARTDEGAWARVLSVRPDLRADAAARLT